MLLIPGILRHVPPTIGYDWMDALHYPAVLKFATV